MAESVPTAETRSDPHHKEESMLLSNESDSSSEKSAEDDDLHYHPDDDCRQGPRYCTACTVTRLLVSPMVLLVLGLVGITYYGYMFQTSDLTTAEAVLFHIVIALLLVSYFQCLLLDPGTIPLRWHYAVKRLPLQADYKVSCSWSPCAELDER
jgi:hypothetical protein